MAAKHGKPIGYRTSNECNSCQLCGRPNDSALGNLYALDASSGAQLWTKNLGAPIAGPATGGYANQGATGLSAGDGLLIVPAGNKVTAYVLSTNP
jgi:hypothetical protein